MLYSIPKTLKFSKLPFTLKTKIILHHQSIKKKKKEKNGNKSKMKEQYIFLINNLFAWEKNNLDKFTTLI